MDSIVLKEKIYKSSVKNHGKLAIVAKDCNLSLSKLEEFLRDDKELDQKIKDLQFEFQELILDRAELMLMEAMEETSRGYANAVKICLFVLTHKGGERGYNKSGALGSQAANKFELLDTLLSADPGDSYKDG